MSRRLGLGIGRSAVRAILLDNRRIVWRGAQAYGAAEELSDVLVQLLQTAPLGRTRKPRIIAAIGPSMTQVKRLHGLPAKVDAGAALQIVCANPTRFFLRNGVRLSTPQVCRNNGDWWGAVIEAPPIAAVEHACKRLGLRVDGCLPATAALAGVIVDGEALWEDAGVAMKIVVQHGQWLDLRRGHESTGTGTTPFARLGLDTPAYADAFAAAASTRRTPLMLRSPSHFNQRRGIRMALGGFCAFAALAALLAPGIVASHQLASEAPRLASARDSAAKWSGVIQELNTSTAILNRIAAFRSDDRSAIALLGAVSHALPDSSAVVALRIDTLGGSVTVLSTSGAAVVEKLSAAREIVDPTIVGTVTKESVGGAQLQRVTMRFRLPRVAAARREQAQ